MKLALFAVLAVAVAAATAMPQPEGRIIGGVNALEGEFPQICMIQWVFLTQQSNICACTILNAQHVITAAHCITEAPTTGRLEVVAGILDHTVIHQNRQRLGVLTSFIHPNFVARSEESTQRFDMAILRTQAPITRNDWIDFAELPVAAAPAGQVVLVAGWGQTGTGILPPSATHLQKIQVAVLSQDACRTALNSHGITLHDEFVCTGPLTGGIGVCNGDSGGPVLAGNTLVGVISYTTSPCAQVNSASVHADVFQARDWINQIINFQ